MNNQRPDSGQNDSPQVEMHKYKCHKEVWALKIKEIRPDPVSVTGSGIESESGGAVIVPEGSAYANFRVDGSYVSKHNPQVGERTVNLFSLDFDLTT